MFDNLAKVEDIGVDVARDIVRKLSIQQGAREVAEEAVKVVSGDHYDPYPIINKLEDLKKIHAATHTGDERVLDLDIDSLLEGMDDEYHYTFNLPSLKKPRLSDCRSKDSYNLESLRPEMQFLG